ncbi:MAG: cyclic nucleotide-binding domain-containing protein, partial [Actinomycetota bacterium]|nr:cyclic nucleotide-binding domain-containing protein [Actinomycetota bacterium]
VRVLVGLLAARSIVIGALDVMVVVIALGLLDLGRSSAGYLTATLGAGGLLGGLVALTLVGRRWLAWPLAGGLLTLGVPVAVVGLVGNPVVAGLLLLAGGSGLTVADVAGRTLLQRVARDEVLTRVFGVLEGLDMAALAVGAFIAPMLASLLDIELALVLVGLFLPLLALLLWKRLQAVDRDAPVRLAELRLLSEVPLFAPLGPPVLEALAHAAIMVEARDGEEVIRQGEEGDRFYVIRGGSVEVSRDGTPVATLGAGDYFGEIALLRDVPRTATVTATGEVRLLALERADFLEAVTGHPVSREEAETVADRRLR